ncbi:DUF4762 family protein [Enterobacillus tribolii]|uniref:Uncharacterized protein DUF4762 n=1 Tax=Enterobacillus tribolii TaxID=1487935 RepID=A0A370QRM4_9GAMM|nr:DUF4762 family protein [Enterobacillus tribolii]MBW7981698.1 DUF4762 domain-containing protein [Enterobacillus tribolii]RDK91077.1 uncharacterized protein DUF4762 [Enterobacillus tribolii]
MKKINMIEAMQVVGGCEDVCTSEFVAATPVGGKLTCVELTTCVDKHGVETQTVKSATLADCNLG